MRSPLPAFGAAEGEPGGGKPAPVGGNPGAEQREPAPFGAQHGEPGALPGGAASVPVSPRAWLPGE